MDLLSQAVRLHKFICGQKSKELEQSLFRIISALHHLLFSIVRIQSANYYIWCILLEIRDLHDLC